MNCGHVRGQHRFVNPVSKRRMHVLHQQIHRTGLNVLKELLLHSRRVQSHRSQDQGSDCNDTAEHDAPGFHGWIPL